MKKFKLCRMLLTENEAELLWLFHQLSHRDQIKWIARTEDYLDKISRQNNSQNMTVKP